MQIIPTLLNILMGIYLCTAAYHFWIAAKKQQMGIQLSFSVVCLMAAGYCLTAKAVYSAPSIPAYLHSLKLQVSVGLVFMVGVVWFTVYFSNLISRWVPTSSERPRNTYAAVAYDGYWYYIPYDDIDSRETLTMLSIVLSLKAGGVPSKGPVLTVPVGGGW